MSERLYLFLVGVYILISLYIGLDYLIYALVAWLVFEAITDLRLTTLLQAARRVRLDSGLVVFRTKNRFDVDAIRAWRLFVAIVLAASYLSVYEYGFDVIWFFPWFMGFAIMGAGASGICPVMLGLKWVGFK